MHASSSNKGFAMKAAGAFILVIGLLMTAYSGYTYVTREKVLELGLLEITAEKEHSVEWQPYVGIATALAGGAILLYSRKRPVAA